MGVKCALTDQQKNDKRVIVIVGDGAFQETCQAASVHSALKHNTIVFVLANGIYGIEQKLVNPNPFRNPPTTYPHNPHLEDIYPYNQLPNWSYEKLSAVFGARGAKVEDHAALVQLLAEIHQDTASSFIVEIKLPRTDVPEAVAASLSEPGEDEWGHSHWPPKPLF